MELRYRVDIQKSKERYSYDTKFSLWGSCFSSELTNYLYDHLFNVYPSPFGIMYNPASIARGLEFVLGADTFVADSLFEQDGVWYSNMHHGQYASYDQSKALGLINDSLMRLREVARDIDVWVFTFGTAYVYEEKSTGEVVNNCHRRSAQEFVRRRLTVEEIVSMWRPLASQLVEYGGKVIFTVSPICHYRDGAHDSRLSKSVLMLAIDQIVSELDGVIYFPSYEIMMDELRDYRFYGADFAHPSTMAVEYIMERFAESYLDITETSAGEIVKGWGALRQMLNHRPMTDHPDKLRRYYTQLLRKLDDFYRAFPHTRVHEAILHVKSSLSQIL